MIDKLIDMWKYQRVLVIASTLGLTWFVCYCLMMHEEGREETKTRRQEIQQERALDELQIVEKGGCEWVLWHNGYGSDMEHHRQCKGCKKLKGEEQDGKSNDR